jgi:acyl carrier protein
MEELYKILEEIKPECDFRNSENYIIGGLLDSFDIILLISELEKAYSISIEGYDIIPENFNRIEAIKRLILKYGVKL